jgi:hypothetical protein
MTIADQLVREIEKAESLKQVSDGSGVPYSRLHGFYNDNVDLRLSNVQALVDYFGFKLVNKRSHTKKRRR